MRTDQIPQDDGGFMHASRFHTYAVDAEGNYAIKASRGWQPVNEAVLEAWERLDERARELQRAIVAGERSPVAYWMLLWQMDERVLAPLVGVGRWRVRRHCRGRVFAGLRPEMIARYARAFQVEPEVLTGFPEGSPLPSEFCCSRIRFYQRVADPAAVAEKSGGAIVIHNRLGGSGDGD